MATPQTITPIAQQNLLDIALQTSGSIEAVFLLAQANGISITADIIGLILLPVTTANKDVLDFYKKNTIRPATGGLPNQQNLPDKLEGVDYWSIEYDFIVT